MENKHIEAAIKHAANELKKDMLPTGNYGKLHRYYKTNQARKFVARHLKVNIEAISKLIFEDRNIYIENSKHHQNNLLNWRVSNAPK